MSSLPESFYLLFVVLLVIGTIAIALNLLKIFVGGLGGGTGRDRYVSKRSLFTAAERSFLGVLEVIDLGHLSIASKVRLADVFDVTKGYSRSRWQSAFNRISAKHVDFLLLQKSDGKPVLGIELDDQSHQRAERKERDPFVDHVFESAGLPLLRIKAQATYNPSLIVEQIEAAISPPK